MLSASEKRHDCIRPSHGADAATSEPALQVEEQAPARHLTVAAEPVPEVDLSWLGPLQEAVLHRDPPHGAAERHRILNGRGIWAAIALVSAVVLSVAIAGSFLRSFPAAAGAPPKPPAGASDSADPPGGSELAAGTRSDPRPVGAPFESGRWRVTLGAVEWDADSRVAAAALVPLPPPSGWQWALSRVSVENIGSETADAGLIDVTLTTPVVAVSSRRAAGQLTSPIPEGLDRRAIAPGEVRSGYLGYLVPVDSADSCLLQIEIPRRLEAFTTPGWARCR
jgi:hypothetical protein